MAAATPFLFGKLPAHGDFVSRGLADPARKAWDDWASSLVQSMHEQWGGRFDEMHDAIQPWRFVAGPSRLGEAWRAGALAPSIDSAGRRFILVLGAQGWDMAQAGFLGLAATQLLDDLIYRALSERLSADAVAAAIQPEIQALESASAAVASAVGASLATPGVWWSPSEGVSVLGAEPGPGILSPAMVQPAWETAP